MSTTSELVERLKAPANWMREERGEHWKNARGNYDRAPFEAAARLDELERENAALREALKPFAWQTRVSSLTEEVMILNARAALAGSGEK
jgi:FtsZ-binding cell division protein ZapB